SGSLRADHADGRGAGDVAALPPAGTAGELMSDKVLRQIQAIIQRDVSNRGLATDPQDNLLTACAGDFAQACEYLSLEHGQLVCILTGFYIPSAGAFETDGPLGAVFLARVLSKLGRPVCVIGEYACSQAIEAALADSPAGCPVIATRSDYWKMTSEALRT